MRNWQHVRAALPGFLGVDRFDASDSATVRTYLDWNRFFQKWDFPIRFPEVLDDAEWGAAARNLFEDANALFDELIAQQQIAPNVVFGVWPAHSEGQAVVVQNGDQPPVTLTFPQLSDQTLYAAPYCLANFIKPGTYLTEGESDYLGGYAIAVGEPLTRRLAQAQTEENLYQAYLLEDLGTLYASAVADYLHYRLRRFIWAYCDDDDLSNEEVVEGLHQGIRVVIGGRECPDSALKTSLFRLLGVDPADFPPSQHDPTNVIFNPCGFFFANPKSRLLDEIHPPDERSEPA